MAVAGWRDATDVISQRVREVGRSDHDVLRPRQRIYHAA
jgi:hypothetical protein